MHRTTEARLHLHTRDGLTYSSDWYDNPATPLHWPPRILGGQITATVIESGIVVAPDSIYTVTTETTVDRAMCVPGGTPVELSQAKRDAPRLHLLPAVADLLPTFGLDMDDVAQIVEDSTSTWESRNGAMIHARDGWQIVVGSDGTVLRINKPHARDSSASEPRAVRGANPAQDPRRGYSSATTKRRTPPGTAKEFRALLEANGFVVTDSDGGHYKATHPDHPSQTTSFPKSPSDHRWSRNMCTAIRQQFGIDLLRD